MHVVQCLTHSKHGGAQEVVFNLVSQLKNRNTELQQTVVLPPHGIYVNRFRELGISVLEVSFNAISVLRLVHFYFLIRKLAPDVIHSHGKGAGFYSRIIPQIFLPVRRVHSYHGFHPPVGRLQNLLYRWLESLLLRATETIVHVSQSECRDVSKALKIAPEKQLVIPNCIDRKKVRESAKTIIDEQVELFFSRNRDSFVISMIGRDDPIKNYPIAFKAIQLLFKAHRKFAVSFVGIEEGNPILSSLTELYPNNILTIPLQDNIAPLLSRSNLLLMTSKKEAAPLVILEALALGIPVVGTNVDGIRDIIIHGVNGLLVEEEPESVAKAILRIEQDRDLYRHLCLNASNRSEAYDITVWAAKYFDVYAR